MERVKFQRRCLFVQWRAIAANELDQVYVVTPVHSFLSIVESEINSICLNDVFVVKTVNASGINVNEQTKDLGRNPYFDKPILIVCAHPKTKAKVDKSSRYADILSSLLSKFRDVFPVADLLFFWMAYRHYKR